MGTRITISFNGNDSPEAIDDKLVHRLRNYGEELYREFSATGHAEISIEDVDSAINELRVFVKSKRHIGAVSAFVKKTLEQHNLDTDFTVSRG